MLKWYAHCGIINTSLMEILYFMLNKYYTCIFTTKSSVLYWLRFYFCSILVYSLVSIIRWPKELNALNLKKRLSKRQNARNEENIVNFTTHFENATKWENTSKTDTAKHTVTESRNFMKPQTTATNNMYQVSPNMSIPFYCPPETVVFHCVLRDLQHFCTCCVLSLCSVFFPSKCCACIVKLVTIFC